MLLALAVSIILTLATQQPPPPNLVNNRDTRVPDSTSCQFSIVSSTVVVAYCGHRVGDDEILDVLIAWRGKPGWFQRQLGASGRSGGGGRRTFPVFINGRVGTGMKGRVSQYQVYNNITTSFDADFDAGTVVVEGVTVELKGLNAIFFDDVEQAGPRPIFQTALIEPSIPLGGDVNLSLARRSRELRQFLQCEVAMPKASVPQPPVITVCEKLQQSPNK